MDLELDKRYFDGLYHILQCKDGVHLLYKIKEVPMKGAIPSDYYGPMGVPITYIDNHCPDEFQIIYDKVLRPSIKGKTLYARIPLVRKFRQGGIWNIQREKNLYFCEYIMPGELYGIE